MPAASDTAPRGGGRVSGRIATDGSAVSVENLEVRDLAGAEASLSGRISSDGTGRIAGRLRAARAAPLVDLFGRAWIGGLATLLPDLVREDPVDLSVAVERVPSAGGAGSSLRTTLEGRLAGGPFRARTQAAGGLVKDLTVAASTDRVDLWLGRPDAAGLRRRGTVSLAGERDGAGRLNLTIDADAAGLRLTTSRALRLAADDDALDGGEADITSADATAFLPLLGLSPTSPGPVSMALHTTLSREPEPRLALSGRVATIDLSADVSGPSPGELTGRVRASRVSLPWLASALVLTAPTAGGAASQVWPSARFGPRPRVPLGGRVRVEAAALDLGSGLAGSKATFMAATGPAGLSVRDLDVAFLGGRLRGSVDLRREGGLASVIGEGLLQDIALSGLLGPPLGVGRMSANLRFGASGESVAALVANLGGAGSLEVDALRIEAADPEAVTRVASRVLLSDDPLATANWQALLPAELGRGPLAAPRVSANLSLVGGALRISPLVVRSGSGGWQGGATVDFKSLTVDVRGTLQSGSTPRKWPGSAPILGLGWSGPLARPVRTIDPAPLVNGLASAVLQRELDRIETFELDVAERSRRNGQVEMDRQRRLAQEEAARQARAREEAERVREREEAERARQEERAKQEERMKQEERSRRDAERVRQDRARQDSERRAAERRDAEPAERAPPPLDIRPPAQSGRSPAGGG